MTFAAIYAIAVGALMILQWTITVVRGRVAGPEAGLSGRGRVEMGFHLVAEFSTALLLIASGAGLLSEKDWGHPLFLVAVGMLIYTVLNSPGFFAQQRKWPLVAMFGVLLGLAVLSLLFALSQAG